METALERSLLKLGKAEDYPSDVQRIYLDLTRQQRFDEVDALERAAKLLDGRGIGYKFPSDIDIKGVLRPQKLDLTDGDVEGAVALCRHYGFEV